MEQGLAKTAKQHVACSTKTASTEATTASAQRYLPPRPVQMAAKMRPQIRLPASSTTTRSSCVTSGRATPTASASRMAVGPTPGQSGRSARTSLAGTKITNNNGPMLLKVASSSSASSSSTRAHSRSRTKAPLDQGRSMLFPSGAVSPQHQHHDSAMTRRSETSQSCPLEGEDSSVGESFAFGETNGTKHNLQVEEQLQQQPRPDERLMPTEVLVTCTCVPAGTACGPEPDAGLDRPDTDAVSTTRSGEVDKTNPILRDADVSPQNSLGDRRNICSLILGNTAHSAPPPRAGQVEVPQSLSTGLICLGEPEPVPEDTSQVTEGEVVDEAIVPILHSAALTRDACNLVTGTGPPVQQVAAVAKSESSGGNALEEGRPAAAEDAGGMGQGQEQKSKIRGAQQALKNADADARSEQQEDADAAIGTTSLVAAEFRLAGGERRFLGPILDPQVALPQVVEQHPELRCRPPPSLPEFPVSLTKRRDSPDDVIDSSDSEAGPAAEDEQAPDNVLLRCTSPHTAASQSANARLQIFETSIAQQSGPDACKSSAIMEQAPGGGNHDERHMSGITTLLEQEFQKMNSLRLSPQLDTRSLIRTSHAAPDPDSGTTKLDYVKNGSPPAPASRDT
ncbi:unnamed protein product [Amoebophrya sp. A120]|nr:unnamed protein product [Amoebophrya sp. A120]|eukprot:GSA120T00004330001.1